MAPSSSPTWHLGAVIGGRYVLEGELGRGGFGAVFRGRSLADRSLVAVKLLASGLRGDEASVARFSREASLARRLTHPSTVRVLDFGDAGDGTPFIVFELLEGKTLERRIAEGPLPPAEALFVTLALIGSLEEAHASGIVHRDVKPSNLLLLGSGTDDGSVKLLDFGIAKVTDDAPALTREGMIIGTAEYMSPEQIDGSAVGPATDLYAAGLVLAEMITGRPLYTGAPMAVCLQKLREGFVSLPEEVVRSPFGAVIERATRRSPDARYATAADLRAALLRTGVTPRAPNAPLRAPSPRPAPGDAASGQEIAPAAPPARRSWRRLVIAALVAVIGGAVALGWVALSPPRGPRGEPPTDRTTKTTNDTRPAVPAAAPDPPRERIGCARPPARVEDADNAVASWAKTTGLEIDREGARAVHLRGVFVESARGRGWSSVSVLHSGRDEEGFVAIFGVTEEEEVDRLVARLPPDARLAAGGAFTLVAFVAPRGHDAGLLAAICGRR
ncbi:MAG: protein kinase [Myxococcales bacterium]|nr:protein kinase [Myxococcales bacterium]